MAEPDDVLGQLDAIRSEMGRMADSLQTLSVEMTAVRQHFAGPAVIERSGATKQSSRSVRANPQRLLLPTRDGLLRSVRNDDLPS